jgi:hypothetical protein
LQFFRGKKFWKIIFSINSTEFPWKKMYEKLAPDMEPK